VSEVASKQVTRAIQSKGRRRGETRGAFMAKGCLRAAALAAARQREIRITRRPNASAAAHPRARIRLTGPGGPATLLRRDVTNLAAEALPAEVHHRSEND
jgi:hypothetical protein